MIRQRTQKGRSVRQEKREGDTRSGDRDPESTTGALQRTLGNQAVQDLLRTGALQGAKAISRPGDAREREAERVAETVMRTSNPLDSSAYGVQPSSATSRSVDRTTLSEHRIDGTATARASASGGHRIPGSERAFFESRFDADLDGVRVHDGTEAACLAGGLNAQAFTHGREIYFGEGRYQPGTRGGRRLLAHELTHVLQNGETGSMNSPPTIYRQRESSDSSSTEETGEDLEARLDRIEQQYREMIRKAREDGYDVAADNLQRFLEGTGGTKQLNVGWLRGFNAVTRAERTNQSRFEKSLADIADGMSDGQTRTFDDYWDRQFTASTFTELYYASGTSTITSTGTFTLTRSGDTTTITGTVEHRWWDPYDWHAGLVAFVPGFGTISDDDALLLQQHRGAGPFDMEATWTQTVSGTITHRAWWFDSTDYTWRGPFPESN
ncbi:eCIS core domain-containing protein [Natronorarus salvus]|uniref:eCIS core domain-containing protein n=1 Tax=Natronorarus salvus TaxID=3117733 RepID=UPI002F26BDF0